MLPVPYTLVCELCLVTLRTKASWPSKAASCVMAVRTSKVVPANVRSLPAVYATQPAPLCTSNVLPVSVPMVAVPLLIESLTTCPANPDTVKTAKGEASLTVMLLTVIARSSSR